MLPRPDNPVHAGRLPTRQVPAYRRSAPVGSNAFFERSQTCLGFPILNLQPHPRGCRRRRLYDTYPYPITSDPAGAPRPRSLRHRPDRDRQDGRFRIADTPAPLQCTGTADGRHLPSASAEPHSRAGQSNRQELPRLWARAAALHCGRVRRCPDWGTAAAARVGCRHLGGNTGAPARPHRPYISQLVEGPDPGSRRGGSNARPRLHPCPEAHREIVAATASNIAVFGDHAQDDCLASRGIPRRPDPGGRHASGDDGRTGRSRGRFCFE